MVSERGEEKLAEENFYSKKLNKQQEKAAKHWREYFLATDSHRWTLIDGTWSDSDGIITTNPLPLAVL